MGKVITIIGVSLLMALLVWLAITNGPLDSETLRLPINKLK